jgi:acyl carrier protein
MRASEALAELAQILPLADRLADPVVTCAEFTPGGALHALPVPASPAFAGLFAGRGASAAEAGACLTELIADKTEAEAHRLVATLVVEEVAQILRLAVADVDLDASIDSLGMDSLMALELRMSIEARHGIELPVMAVSAAGTLRELAHRILQTLRQGAAPDEAAAISDTESALIAMHGGESGGAADAGDFAESKRNRGSSH